MASSPNWVGPPCLTAKPPHLPGPQRLREPNPPAGWSPPSQARAGGPPWGRVLRVACGVCARSPGAPHCVTRCHKPPAGGLEAPGLPDKKLVGLVAPGGTQQGWEALQCTSHRPRGSSPCGVCRTAPVSWKPPPVYTVLGSVKILTLLGGKWKKPDETLFSLATGHAGGADAICQPAPARD